MEDPYNRHRVYWHATWSTEPPSPMPLYNTCGCNLCVGQQYRKYLRRQERGAWRAVRQRLMKTRAVDREDMEWYAPISEVW